MDMQVNEVDGITVVKLDGRFDINGALAVDDKFKALADEKAALAVDMSGVSFLASLGVRTLMLTAKTMLRRGARIAVFGADDNVDKVLRATGFNEIVSISPDFAAAEAALKA